MKLRALLLQARHPHDPMGPHEKACFVEQTGLPANCIDTHDLLQGPPSLQEVRQYDMLMVGGSGDFYVSKGNLPHFDKLCDTLREVAEVAHPTFASCFGYQCLVSALGGTIVHDPPNTEVGTYILELTDDGAADPLFSTLPRTFNAQMGHKDRAICHPDGMPNLAASQQSPFQAFRIPDKPIWATQFHPELTGVSNRARYEHYLDGYQVALTPEQRAEALSRFHDSPESSSLLARFVKLVFY